MNRKFTAFFLAFLALAAVWQVTRSFWTEEEKQLRSQIRNSFEQQFTEEIKESKKRFGLAALNPHQADARHVILIHGLDDPGKVWMNLSPRLQEEDFNVWLLQYPNDQPVTESARFFFNSLQGLRQTGIRKIAIVAHSMGGLVSREMLTSPEIAYNQSVKNEKVPEVDRLIMVGTPNHGSQMARFRMFGELRDHLIRLTTGEADWLGGILDGAGEAKIDLLPGSRFLTELNARPHPAGMDMLIIAGITSPWKEKDIQRWSGDLRRKVPDDLKKSVDELGRNMIALTHGLGDGLVTVESTRLEGIDHQTVDGTHLSMIRNITSGSERIPPSVPVIVERLKTGSSQNTQ